MYDWSQTLCRLFFFFQAEDGIRDSSVTGVQTCALPIFHLDPQQAGTVAGIFFWGYLVLQIPGGHLAKHWSAKKFISVLLVVWAVFAVGCGFARTYHELLLLRLLL